MTKKKESKNVQKIVATLRKTRKEKGLIQQQVADTIGVNRVTVKNIEKTTSNPYAKDLDNIAKIFGFRLALIQETAEGVKVIA